MKKQIEMALQVLIGMPLSAIGRACTLEWFIFGTPREITDHSQQTKIVEEYALHIQCSWRITDSKSVVVGSQDRYIPSGDPDQEVDDFEWDVKGANRCDERVAQLLNNEKSLIVTEIEVGSVGSFRLTLNDEYVLEVFPNNSLDDEYWRLFESDAESEHFVVTGIGVEEA